MANNTLPPPPTGQGVSYAWQDWYLKLHRFLTTADGILWAQIDKTGSNLADLVTRLHSSLQGVQGGTTGQAYHLTNAEHTRLIAAPTITIGTSTLIAGTAVVSTALVTANTVIQLTGQNSSGTPGEIYVSARTPGASFTITSSSGADTRTVGWTLMEP